MGAGNDDIPKDTLGYDREKLVVLSGCSGGGKTTILQALSDRGNRVVPEPGRQIVKKELASGGQALPWVDIQRFANECVSLSAQYHKAAAASGRLTFFERSLVDGVVALESRSMAVSDRAVVAIAAHRYSDRVYLVPPWEELFENDLERNHSFADACAEYDALLRGYPAHGYQTMIIPKGEVADRVGWLENELKLKNNSTHR